MDHSDVNLDDSADIFANSSVETVTEVDLAQLSAEEVKGLDQLAQQLSVAQYSQPLNTSHYTQVIQSECRQSVSHEYSQVVHSHHDRGTNCQTTASQIFSSFGKSLESLVSLDTSDSSQRTSSSYEGVVGNGHHRVGTSQDLLGNCQQTAGCREKFTSPYASNDVTLHSSDTSFVLSQVVRERCESPVRLFCPFCMSDFGFDFLLKMHIKEAHVTLLHRALRSQARGETLVTHPCPYCPAKFCVAPLLPRHILTRHAASTLSTFPSESPSGHLLCYFCPYKVLRRHYKLLLIHIEKKHIVEFERYVDKKYSVTAESTEDFKFLDSEVIVTDQIVSPGLSEGMQALRTHDDKVIYTRRPVLIKPILKAPTDEDQPLLESDSERFSSRGACRRLRFDLPDSPLEGKSRLLDTSRMNKAFAKKDKKRFKWKFSLIRRKKKEVQDNVSLLSSPLKTTPVRSSLDLSPEVTCLHRYKCGMCAEKFSANGTLVEHVRRKHKGIKLKSLYHCGECSAKFFRNSFLVQHCALQHSPLCLKAARSRRSIAANF